MWFPLLTVLLLGLSTVSAQHPCDRFKDKSMHMSCMHMAKWETASRKVDKPIGLESHIVLGENGTKKLEIFAESPSMASNFPMKMSAPIASPYGMQILTSILGNVPMPIRVKAVAKEPSVQELQQCMDLDCVCKNLGASETAPCVDRSGRPLNKVIRKEYRLLTDEERKRFHDAVNVLKEDGTYHAFARIHANYNGTGGPAHSGPSFLPWHREMLKRFELELRRIDPSISIPYWDSTMDTELAVPMDSVLFTDELFGRSDNSQRVISGPCKGWKNYDGSPLLRNGASTDRPFFKSDIEYMMRENNVRCMLGFYTTDLKACPEVDDYSLEMYHGRTHNFVGGTMLQVEESSNDLIFYMHHSYVDFLWEQWRRKFQTPKQRETVYRPENLKCASKQHQRNSPMSPFAPLRNVDGLSNKYTDNLYEFAPIPTCSVGNTDCGSKYLFCNTAGGQPRCSTKIKPGGNCAHMFVGDYNVATKYNVDPCYDGQCVNGKCVASAVPKTEPSRVTPPQRETQAQPQSNCTNDQECCIPWAAFGECQSNPQYMLRYCKASCGECVPTVAIRDDCTDRHPSCAQWSKQGECNKTQWMPENCRRSCKLCGTSRNKKCGY